MQRFLGSRSWTRFVPVRLGCSLAFAIAVGLIAQVPPSPASDANALESQIASALKQGDAVLARPDANPAEALPFYQIAWDLATQLDAASLRTQLEQVETKLAELRQATQPTPEKP